MTPPTIVVVHPREKRRKCTVRALREREGFAFHNYRPTLLESMPHDLTRYVRLGLGGSVLSEREDANFGLLVLDGTWRHVQPIERMFASVPVRSLPSNIATAYPRTSKVMTDPAGGLATIEAIYAAYELLGRDTKGLLDHYRWALDFVRLNESNFINVNGVLTA